MNSLVGYGVSSESDSDGDVKDANNGGVCSFRETGGEASAVKKTRNFLLESGSASSESDPEEEDPEPSLLPPHPQKPASSAARRAASPPGFLASHKLPPPSLNTSSDSGVFANPFKAQADRKLSALQKHVPLTMQAKPSQIGGKKVCVSYRKNGRCRFGIKCKFAHDSDLQTLADSHPPVSEETPGSGQAESRAGGSRGGASQNLQQTKEEEESGGQQVKKRKVGLSNTLIPPKRAMKQYTTQRDREQINMS